MCEATEHRGERTRAEGVVGAGDGRSGLSVAKADLPVFSAVMSPAGIVWRILLKYYISKAKLSS